MELPPYRSPTASGVLWHVWEKTSQYAKKAGTVILAASVLILAITNFPVHEAPAGADRATVAREALEYSAASRVGKFIEPVFTPLGFDWRIGVPTITGFAAKEVVVSTLGILFRVGAGEEEEHEGLRQALRNDPAFNPLVAFILVRA